MTAPYADLDLDAIEHEHSMHIDEDTNAYCISLEHPDVTPWPCVNYKMAVRLRHLEGAPLPTATPRTTAEKKAFEADWDRRVIDGWERNGKPPAEVQMAGKTYPPSIIGTRSHRERRNS